MEAPEIKYTAPYYLIQGYEGDTCYDLRLNMDEDEYDQSWTDPTTGKRNFEIGLEPGETKLLKTGLYVELPEGWAAEVTGRSGNSKRGLQVILGKIDATYRGEIGVVVFNSTDAFSTIAHLARIAQIEIYKKDRHTLKRVKQIDDATERGIAGFGSTGTH